MHIPRDIANESVGGPLLGLGPLLPNRLDRQVVSFYSYRGGVGRSMALANVAQWLSDRLRHGHEDYAPPPQEADIADTRRSTDGSPKAIRDAVATDFRDLPHLGVLCVDFDLDAPGLDTLLPPVNRFSGRGLLGLLADLSEVPRESFQSQLERAFACDPSSSPYYYIAGTSDNLVVMPSAGPALRDDERERARTFLSIVLHDIAPHADDVARGDHTTPVASGTSTDAQPTSSGGANFFSVWRDVLRRAFAYTLVDARTGLADEAFATTTLLPDALVLLVPPKPSHLAPVQRVLAEFLHAKGLRASDPSVPVVSVLSPRPAFSDPRLGAFRRVIRKYLFNWLDTRDDDDDWPRIVGPRPRLIELPFDMNLQVGEQLLIASANGPEDTEAPLYRAYVRLARAVQQGNAEHDPEGALSLERDLQRDGRSAEALRCLLSAIAVRPRAPHAWMGVLRRYREHLSHDLASRNLVLRFCEALTRHDEHTHVISTFFADMVRAELIASEKPELATRHLRRAWNLAKASQDSLILGQALAAVVRLYGHRPEHHLPGVPRHIDAVEAGARLALDGTLTAGNLLRILMALARAYERVPRASTALVDVLQDQLELVRDSGNYQLLCADLSRAYEASLDFRRALAYARRGARSTDAPSHVQRHYVDLACRLGAATEATAFVNATDDPGARRHLEVALALRIRRSSAWALRLLDRAYGALEPGEGLSIARAFVRLNLGEFPAAAVALRDVQRAMRSANEDIETLLGIVDWLNSDRETPLPILPSFDQIDTTLHREVLTSPAVIYSLLSNPDALFERAVMELERNEQWPGAWPMSAFGWALIASGHPDPDRGHAAGRRAKRAWRFTPGLASVVCSHEFFPLLREVVTRRADHHEGLARIETMLRTLTSATPFRPARQRAANAERMSTQETFGPTTDARVSLATSERAATEQVAIIQEAWRARLDIEVGHGPLSSVYQSIRQTQDRRQFLDLEGAVDAPTGSGTTTLHTVIYRAFHQ